MDERKEQIRKLIISKAIETREEGFTLASGIKSRLYIDLRKITQDPQGIGLIGSLVLEKIRSVAPDAECVGGLETGSIPISTAVSLLSAAGGKRLNAFWVRKKPKDHGLQNRIEGNLRKSAKVVIVEDTATTGGSSLQAAEAVREFGSEVVLAIAIVDRGAAPNFEKSGIPYYAFFSEKELSN